MLVGIEWLPYTNIATAADAQAIVEAAGRANGGYCADIWHHRRGADDDALIRALPGERVFAVQMDDGPRRPQLDDYKQDCLANRVPPGEGEFDCVGFVRLLAEIGVRCADLARGVLDGAVGGAGGRGGAAGRGRHARRAGRGPGVTLSRYGTRVGAAADALGGPAGRERQLDVLDLVPLVHHGAVGDLPLAVPALEAIDVAPAERLQHHARRRRSGAGGRRRGTRRGPCPGR